MKSNQNVLNCILISFIIVVCVHFLFSKPIPESIPKRVIEVNQSLENFKEINKENKKNKSKLLNNMYINKLPCNDEDSLEYMKGVLTSKHNHTSIPKAVQTRKEFNNDFFSFREATCENSSIKYDAVDKVQQLYLDGNMNLERGQQKPVKIKDLFDNITSSSGNNIRNSVKLPEFNNLESNSYTTSRTSPSQGGWKYPNEKISNGGQIIPGLSASDPFRMYNMPV